MDRLAGWGLDTIRAHRVRPRLDLCTLGPNNRLLASTQLFITSVDIEESELLVPDKMPDGLRFILLTPSCTPRRPNTPCVQTDQTAKTTLVRTL